MRTSVKQVLLLFLILTHLASLAGEIDQRRGLDQRVDYKSLTAFGPWDDRNYQLTLEDLSYLSPEESKLAVHIPAFFRVLMRKANPNLPRTGDAQYPRSAPEIFRQLFQGIMIDGKISNESGTANQKFGTKSIPLETRVPVNSEVRINVVTGAAESTILHNHINPNLVIAGANGGSGGQEMYYSSDGGQTWNTTPALTGNTCCDPTVEWSFDGTIAYAGTLGDCGFSGCGVWFYRSTNNGQTWGNRIQITNAGLSDKEFIHVDRSPTSPFRDNIYVTWHDGNVMQFTRSIDLGLSFAPVQSFGGSATGIGSDITTDAAGNIYYIWPGTGTQAIWMRKSVDGGVSFAPQVKIEDTNASFDYNIPAMETRRAWVFVSAASDQSGGPFHNSIYACWTDTTGPESTTAAQNHSRIVFAYSRDGGATWTSVIPHPTDNLLTVDRFNAWMECDVNGTIHVTFYDTQRDPTRQSTDLFYTYSEDGGQTFIEPERITSVQSPNIGDTFEYGDYNGISVTVDKVLPTWTDNRAEGGGGNDVDTYVADVDNVTGEPNFTLALDAAAAVVCAPGMLQLTATIGQIQGFSNDVTLDLGALPTGFSAIIAPNPVTPPGQATIDITVSAAAAPGDYQLTLSGTATGSDGRQAIVTVTVQTTTLGGPTLSAPVNGELNAGATIVPLAWQAVAGATEYHVQVSEDMGFGTTTVDDITSAANFLASGLTQNLTYYWRVSTINSCGEGAFSAPFSFFTGSETVLLVDQDDGTPDVRSFFTDTLDALAVSYKIHDHTVQGTPTLVDLAQHPMVVWFSGDRFLGPDATDLTNLIAYVNGGGKIFLSSQDFLYPFRPNVPADAQSLFGIATVGNDTGDYTSVTGLAGSIFEGMGSFTLNYSSLSLSDFSDIITADPPSLLAMQGNNGNGAAIVTDNTVFFAFPFPALHSTVRATSAPLQQVMQAIIDWLLGGGEIDCKESPYFRWISAENFSDALDFNDDDQIDVRDLSNFTDFCENQNPKFSGK